jgi:hypothetical protein
LALLGKSGLLNDAYLAGGSAAALQLGHRISVDFDFFTPQEFIPSQVAADLSQVGSFIGEQADKGTILGKFEGIKFGLFIYKYPLLYPLQEHLSVKIADIRDIAAMKVEAIASRGAKRDFIDLYFICKGGYSLAELLGFYDKKYGKLASNVVHIRKSLIYFDDAEPETMPNMLKGEDWKEIKEFFVREVRRIGSN